MGMPSDEINKLNLEALRSKEDQPVAKPTINFHQEPRALPGDCRSLLEWLEAEPNNEVIAVVDYLAGRGMELEWYNWMWSSENGYRDRVMIPFYQDGVVVGFTGRKIKPGKPKYLTDSQSGYVFNIDRQTEDREYVIVVEGQFDAIAVDGVAIMTNEPNATQVARINRLGKKVIVVPDKDKPGAKLIEHALENNWAVSMPQWGNDIKDSAQAVEKYGRLYTLFTILHYIETNEIKIKLYQKKLEALEDEQT
jgi:5S rRNA maturation endonuclease (ribonuclease M5)